MTLGLIAMPFYTLFEAVGPVVEMAGYAFVLLLFLLGLLSPSSALLF